MVNKNHTVESVQTSDSRKREGAYRVEVEEVGEEWTVEEGEEWRVEVEE